MTPDERGTAWWAWAAWIVGAGGYLGAFAWAMTVLPERVVAYVGPDGVDRWGSRTEHAVMSVILGLVILPMPWLFRFVAKPPGTWLNMPHKDYWFATPERTATLRRKLFEDGLTFTGLTAAFLALVIQVGVVQETRDPGSAAGWAFPIALVVYLGLTVVWLVAVLRRHTPPSDDPGR